MKKKKELQNKIIIYSDKKGSVELRADVEKETIWASGAQIAELFSTDRSVIGKHMRNIFSEGELREKSVCAKFAHTAKL